MSVGDEHITRAARWLWTEFSGGASVHTWEQFEVMNPITAAKWRAKAIGVLRAAGAVGDVIPPPPDVVDAEQIRAAVAMCYPEDMTPSAKRAFDSILENAARGVVLPEPPTDEIFDDFGDAGEWSVRPEGS